MRRREFIKVIAGSAAWPLIARAQQPTMPVIGFLNGGSPSGYASNVNAFHQGLKEAGYTDGQNVTIAYRWANDELDRLPVLADNLIRLGVSVIVANTPANLIAKSATTTIPIVFTTGGDPVKLGLVASLDRPGGNVTGATQLNEEVVPKRLELLHELLPSVTAIALLINPTDYFAVSREVELAARNLGLQLQVLQASTERDFDEVLASLIQLRAGGLVISPGTLFANHSEQLGALTLRHSVPAIFEYREFVAAGGLASYGGSVRESYRMAGIYSGRILKGEKPADLPVQRSTKVEMYINLKTAKAFGITVPNTLIGRADEVIE
jgi:putative ABC transport system substrate-binding protein